MKICVTTQGDNLDAQLDPRFGICHGCGGCSLLCPEGAIKEVDRNIGVI